MQQAPLVSQHVQQPSFSETLSQLRRGDPVILFDRHTAGAQNVMVYAADLMDADRVNFLARHARGLICLALPKAKITQLGLFPMHERGHMKSRTRFAQSIEAAEGTTTGISAKDRATTISVATAPHCQAADIVSPGHVFPIICNDISQTATPQLADLAVALCEAATGHAAAVLCDMLDEDGNAAGPAHTMKIRHAFNLPLCSGDNILRHQLTQEPPLALNWIKTVDLETPSPWHFQSLQRKSSGAEIITATQMSVPAAHGCKVYMTHGEHLRRPFEDFGWSHDTKFDALLTGEPDQQLVLIGMEGVSELLTAGHQEQQLPALRDLVATLMHFGISDITLLNFAPNLCLQLDAFGISCKQGSL